MGPFFGTKNKTANPGTGRSRLPKTFSEIVTLVPISCRLASFRQQAASPSLPLFLSVFGPRRCQHVLSIGEIQHALAPARGRPIMLKSLFGRFSVPKLGPASVLKNKVFQTGLATHGRLPLRFCTTRTPAHHDSVARRAQGCALLQGLKLAPEMGP